MPAATGSSITAASEDKGLAGFATFGEQQLAASDNAAAPVAPWWWLGWSSFGCSKAFSRRSLTAAAQLKLRTPPQSQGIFALRSSAEPESLTIGRLARAAGVGVETIRYYQDRKLLPVPPSTGAFRYYPASLVERIRFIKRAQELGFSLGEIAQLLRLEDGADRGSIRHIATDRLSQIEQKLTDLRRMRNALMHLVAECEHTGADLPCPIIGTLAATR